MSSQNIDIEAKIADYCRQITSIKFLKKVKSGLYEEVKHKFSEEEKAFVDKVVKNYLLQQSENKFSFYAINLYVDILTNLSKKFSIQIDTYSADCCDLPSFEVAK